jgi:hypothetical protein
MSVQAGFSAIEAVGKAPVQSPAEMLQAAVPGNELQLAQVFESGLTKASETSAVSLQVVEDARRIAPTLSGEAAIKPSNWTQLEVRPQGGDGGLSKGIASYMKGFESRTSTYPSELDDFVEKISSGPRDSGIGGAGSAFADPAGKTGLLDAREALHMVERSFQFAIEAELVSNASKHSTQVFNDLMKGQ